MGRWADVLQARIPDMGVNLTRLGPREQIWGREGLGALWGMPEDLGLAGSGAELGDDVAAGLPLRSKDDVLDYARLAFASLEEILERLDDAELLDACTDVFGEPSNVADFFLYELSHGLASPGNGRSPHRHPGRHGTVTV